MIRALILVVKPPCAASAIPQQFATPGFSSSLREGRALGQASASRRAGMRGKCR